MREKVNNSYPSNPHGEYCISDVHAPKWSQEKDGLFLEGSSDMSANAYNPCLAEAPFRMKVACESDGFALGAEGKEIARVFKVPFWESGKIWFKHGYPEDDAERFKKFCDKCGIEKYPETKK